MTPQELKNSILQLAIQGKLVDQRLEEGTAEELYQQIQAEKRRLVKEGKIKKEKPLPEIAEDEVPFEIPESWKWVRLLKISVLENGDRSSKYPVEKDYADFGIPFFGAKDMNGFIMSFDNVRYISEEKFSELGNGKLKNKDFVCLLRGAVGKCAVFIADEQHETGFICAQMVIIRCISKDVCDYLQMYLASPYYSQYIESKVTGTAVRQLPAKELGGVFVPLPPLAEQKRIVAKIEELLPYIDRYERAWSCLELFNKRFPSDMQKSLLQLAIQGKLVEQRPEEGTAEELYQQIQSEKRRLVTEGKIKKEKPLPKIAENEVPFEIPESWKWVRLNGISLMIGDIDHKMPPTVEEGGVPYISPLNFTKDGGIDYSGAKHVSFDDFIQLGRKCTPSLNDIIFPRYGTIGVIRLVDTDKPFLVSYSCCTIKNLSENLMSYKYTFYVLQSHMIQDEINRYINKTTQPNVGLQSIKNFLFPLPPLAEQKRIVAKLEELLPLCERLK